MQVPPMLLLPVLFIKERVTKLSSSEKLSPCYWCSFISLAYILCGVMCDDTRYSKGIAKPSPVVLE